MRFSTDEKMSDRVLTPADANIVIFVGRGGKITQTGLVWV